MLGTRTSFFASTAETGFVSVENIAQADVQSARPPGRLSSFHPIVPWIIGFVLLLPLPLLMSNAYHQYVVNIILINIILAVGLNIVKGFAGQVTVGHIAIAAIGAYSSAVPEPRLEWVVSAAASIARHLIDHGFSVALTDTTAGAVDVADRKALATAAMLRRLAGLELSRQTTLDRALAGSPTGVRGQLLIALLARLDDRDAAALADARRDHRACWALVREPALIGHNALRLLEAAGWRCVKVPMGTSVEQAWRMLGGGS